MAAYHINITDDKYLIYVFNGMYILGPQRLLPVSCQNITLHDRCRFAL